MNIPHSTILITGGGTGLGKGWAEAFHAQGAKVIVAGRKQAPLDAVVAANPGIESVVLDVADKDAVTAFAKTAAERWPGLNAVINNAGIMQAEDLTTDEIDLSISEATIEINLLGPLRLTAALLPQLKAQPNATVLTVSSGLAFVPMTATPTYSATKAAIHSWSQSLRTQLKDTSVEVIEIAPPGVATDLMPGHAENPNSMPLADYIAETMSLLGQQPPLAEINVERVKPLRFAEANGQYDTVFGMVNGPH